MLLNRIITIGIFSTLFFSSYVFFKSPFEGYFSYIIIVVLLPFFIARHKFPTGLFKLMLPLLLFGLLSVMAGDNTGALFFKIFINVFISALFFNYLFKVYDFDIGIIVNYYMKGAFIVSLIGVVQLISFIIGFEAGYDYSWILNKWGVSLGGIFGIRLNSIFSEPSYFGASIGPAFFISSHSLVFRKTQYLSKWNHLLIIACYLLTFSTIAYAGVFITLILLLINFGFVRYVAVFLPILIISYYYLYNNVAEFRMRMDGLSNLYSGESTSAFEVHGSSFVQYNNFHIAIENFKKNIFFGTGLGSYPLAYDKYSLVSEFGGIYEFNRLDGNSMALRLMSETGLYGMLLMLFFIYKFFVRRNENGSNELYWIASNAALVMIILQLLRQGNYTYNGFIFYMWLYYFNYLAANSLIESEQTVDSLVEEQPGELSS